MNSIIANPISIAGIRKLTDVIRYHTDYNDKKYFPIEYFIETVLPSIDPKFSLIIESHNEMGSCHGIACPEKSTITIREDVYERAISGTGRDRFTLAHELGHYLLHTDSNVSLARIEKGKKIEPYKDPEWQANTFAAELLVPLNLITTDNIDEIASTFGVSHQVASIRLKKLPN